MLAPGTRAEARALHSHRIANWRERWGLVLRCSFLEHAV